MNLLLTFPIFNGLSYTKDCLKNLHKQIGQGLNIDILIVDDGSSDGSAQWIIQNYPDVVVLKGDGSLWWSGGINMGIKYALENLSTDYVLLWNNDIIAQESYFKEIFSILEKNALDNIVASKILLHNAKEETILSLGGEFNPKTGYSRLRGWGLKDGPECEKIYQADWFPGMGTCIHRSIFEDIGLFDEKNFPQYHGDADYGLRATKAGYTISVYPNLKIWNNRDNTGLSNNTSFGVFVRSMFTLKSNNNLYRDILFYKRHTTSVLAYKRLFKKYFRHIGGYFKWKFLNLFASSKYKRSSL